MLQSLASWRAAISRDDYLHVRVKRLMVWAESRSIVELQLTAASHPEADLYALALPHFCTSRFLCAPEFRNLVVACRGSCRTLARPDLLEPLMKVSELGYCQIQGLSQTATKRLAWLDEGIRKAQASMRTLGLSSLTPLKVEMKVGEPVGETTFAHALLEPTASLVGDNNEQGDSFGARCLLSEGPAFLNRARALRPENVPLLRRKRFRRAFAKHRELIRQAADGAVRDSKGHEPEVFWKLASWLVIMDAWFENLPLVASLSSLRESLVAHIAPLTAWLVRPHRGPLLGRAMPPPDPPDAVLKDQEKVLRSFSLTQEGDAEPKPVIEEVTPAPSQREPRPKVVTTEAVPFLVGRWLKENSTLDYEEICAHTVVETDRSSEVRMDEIFGGDSGTLAYSSDEEDADMSPSPRTL
eukprot:s7216_g4.t1